ncbi:hypothetical protein N7533_004858 [Penicillium manginii]|uniref:uncharacterized protein n=1 Tax=Penicillium manginii TaxID=203109 RepID=UPI002549A725|nr:uncharacterized protein N7533_006548 [Penicillium manginii]XP_056961138.1 uncharacterized protein N7533_004858 [Penicillium manginii]KAJ5749520.1 hypothetical protein N7533_006548 [Penicillium manginii]KAJ5755315.1 hypothetical protein N7533_004858 [Penicillium manginii]
MSSVASGVCGPLVESYDLPSLNTYCRTATESITPSICSQQLQLPRAPLFLTRTGPHLQRFWILVEMDPATGQTRKDFTEWWLQTEYSTRKDIETTIHWDHKKRASVWDHFEQVAHKRTGEPKVMCKRCLTTLTHPNIRRGGTSPMNTHLKGNTCHPKHGIGKLLAKQSQTSRATLTTFSEETLAQKVLSLILVARLPFRILDRPEFQELADLIAVAPSRVKLPSRTISRQLHSNIQQGQQSIIDMLPEDSRLSLSLDCWTSPFQQGFMAITGYFLDNDWEYREALLGFKPLQGSHTGSNLSSVVIGILEKYKIADRVLSVTTDNATNNNTMMLSIQDELKSQGVGSDGLGNGIFRVPCLAHVIQLSLNQLLGKIKAMPSNNEAEDG